MRKAIDWDSEERVQDLWVVGCGCDDTARNRSLAWLAAILLTTDVPCHAMIILQGKQGSGKTSFLEELTAGISPEKTKFFADTNAKIPPDEDSLFVIRTGEIDVAWLKTNKAQIFAEAINAFK